MEKTGHYRCPNTDCTGEAPAFAVAVGCIPADNVSVGVLLGDDGNASNQWADGAFGVPAEIREMVDDHTAGGCPPHCFHCGEEAEWIRA